MVGFQLVDGTGTKAKVKITALGQLVVAPFAYDEAVFKELAADDTAYNFYEPKSGEQFVITVIHAKADRDVSNTVDAVVVVYEATSNSTTTVSKILYQEAMVRGENFSFVGLNILVGEGKWVNAKTTDDDIHMTIMGYYIPKLG